MNKLKPDKQEMVLNLLVEGNSIRSVVRVTGVNKTTIIRLLRETGAKCQKILDNHMRDLELKRVQTDEIWTYVFKKKERLPKDERDGEMGDQFVFVALDADTKLITWYVVGKRTGENALRLMDELRKRVKNRFQLTTDAFRGYPDAVGSCIWLSNRLRAACQNIRE